MKEVYQRERIGPTIGLETVEEVVLTGGGLPINPRSFRKVFKRDGAGLTEGPVMIAEGFTAFNIS